MLTFVRHDTSLKGLASMHMVLWVVVVIACVCRSVFNCLHVTVNRNGYRLNGSFIAAWTLHSCLKALQ